MRRVNLVLFPAMLFASAGCMTKHHVTEVMRDQLEGINEEALHASITSHDIDSNLFFLKFRNDKQLDSCFQIRRKGSYLQYPYVLSIKEDADWNNYRFDGPNSQSSAFSDESALRSGDEMKLIVPAHKYRKLSDISPVDIKLSIPFYNCSSHYLLGYISTNVLTTSFVDYGHF